MTIEELLEKYKKKYPGVPYERTSIRIKSKKNGKLHSYGDAPAIVYDDGSELWYKEGKKHRENDLPAYIQIGEIEKKRKEWWYNGKVHRENDKPAVVYDDGTKEYWYNGKEYDLTDTPEQNKNQINKITTKKSSKQKRREDLLKEFVVEMLST